MAFFPKKPLTPLEKGYIAPTPSATKVDGSGVVQPISGTVTVNSGEGVDTSALAKEVTLQSTNTRLGNTNETVASSDTTTSGINGLLKRIAQRLTSILTTLGTPFQTGDSIGNTAFGVNNGAGASAVNIQDGGNSITVDGTVTAVPSGTQNVDITANSIGIATEATLAAVQAKTDNLDVALSTRLNTLGQKTSANSAPVVIASDQSAIPISGTVTATVDTSLLSTKAEQETQTNLLEQIVPNIDLFGLLQTGQPQSLFDAQFTYGLQPLLYSARNNGGAVAHSTTERCAVFTGAANATPYMQSYEYIRYQPAKMQKIFLTGNFRGGETDTVKYFQYGDSLNAISIQCLANGDLRIRIITSTSEGNQEVVVNPATFGIDLSKENIMVINFEALYVGTVKVQFQILKKAVDVAVFDNANETDFPYIATANLPIKVGMICGAGAGAPTMLFNCVSVQTVGGQEDTLGYPFSAYSGLITAGNGTRTHLLSLQPKLLFNGFENRTKFVLESVDFIVTGNSPVFFELGIGQALTGDVWSDVNTTHSAMERSLGTISGAATMYFDGALLASTASSKSSSNSRTVLRMPITLDDLGAQHLNGRLSFYGTGQGGTSACGVKPNWKEIY